MVKNFSFIFRRAGRQLVLRGLRHLAAVVLAVASLSPAIADDSAAHPAPDPVSIDRTDWTLTSPGVAPAADATWQAVDLPLHWHASESAPLQGVALRMRFDLDDISADAYAALIPLDTEGGWISVNGHFVGAIAHADEHTQVHFQRPHLLAIDPALLHLGSNVLLIETAFRGGSHAVGRVDVGRLSVMSRWYERRTLLSSTISWVGLTVAAVIALIFGMLWIRRGDPYMGLITMAALFWSLRSGTYVVEIMPLALRFWVRLVYYASVGGFAAVMTILLLRMSDLRNRREEILVAGYGALGAVGFIVTAQRAAYYLDVFWLPGLIAMPAFAVVMALISRFHGRNSPNSVVLGASVLAFVSWAHDYAADRGWIEPDSMVAMHWAGPLLLAALATPLVDRFVGILREAEAAREELETRVREREQLLKRNFERLRQSERFQAESQERQRIMQDMHDGLGSQLLSSLMLVERGAIGKEQVAQILRESMDDLRLAIDALAPEQTDLGAALGNLRFRVEPRMRAAGIELIWDARNLPEEVPLHHDAVLPVLRIVQEALTNALKHSQAKTVRVSMGVEQVGEVQWLDIRVADNGRGELVEGGPGRGLLNMRNRAGKIGALLNIESRAGSGTVVQLLYKLASAAEQGQEGRGDTQLNTQAIIERSARM